MKNRLFPHGVRSRHYLGLTFVAALTLAILLVAPIIAYNGGIFYYYGDFNVQEIPFYQLIHSQVRSGDLGWNHLTDIGTDTLASYSFYLMGSPFFWMTIPFPNEFVPYLIGPLLILKFACAATAAYCWLQRHVRFKGYAVIGAMLYAFSGFSAYNVFFFHFHEPMIVFPLLLAALDCFLYDKRRGIFAVAVFAACVVNYYFFVGQALFVAMYYLTLMLTKTCRFRLREFFLLALEVILGFLGTMFILLPSILGTLGNPRLDSYPNGWKALVHGRPQRYFLTLFATVPEVFWPIDFIASRVAGASFVVRRSSDDSVVWRLSHPVNGILSNPNCLMGWYEFIYNHFVYKLCTGNAYVRAAMGDHLDADSLKWKYCDTYWNLPAPRVQIEPKNMYSVPLFGVTPGGRKRRDGGWPLPKMSSPS